MNRTDRNAIRAAQAAERKALLDAFRAARKEEKATRRREEEEKRSAAQAIAAERQARERDSYRQMCRGLVMARVRAAGGSLEVVTLAKGWPVAVPRSALDDAIETLTGAGELVLQTPADGPAVLVVPVDLSAAV